jgi:arylsulfatase A-like enzyme
LIIYTSDHGDFMGDHGLLNKGPLHYRSLIRVPFIWADPSAPKALRDNRLCSSIDLGTSILARAGIEKAQGDEFDVLFLTHMIAHHEGAVDMANDVLASTTSPRVRELATAIVESQTAEIAEMEALLYG